MPGTPFAKRPLAAVALAALALALAALPGCYARQAIPSDPPGATAAKPAPSKSTFVIKDDVPKAELEIKAEAAKAEAPKAEPAKAESAKAAPEQAAPAQAAPEQAKPAQDNATAAQDSAINAYYVQIGSFATAKNAEGAVTWLREKGHAQTRIVLVEQGATTYHRVQAGPYPSYAAARKVLEELRIAWPQVFIPGD